MYLVCIKMKKELQFDCNSLIFIVGPPGLEPGTP
jgi:hypothetical protein